MSKVVLGEIATFIRGITFKPTDVVPLGTVGSIACLRTKNVQANLDVSDTWAIPKTFVKSKEKLLQEGDLLVSTANSWNLVGKCSWVPALNWDATAGGFVSILRPNQQKINPRFLYHWFIQDETQAKLRSCSRQTTNISNLNITQAQAIALSIPSLEEQKRIAAILDQANELRRLRQRAIERLNELGQAIFYEMFGDPEKNPFGFERRTLGEIIEFIGGSQPAKSHFLYEDGPDRVRFVQIRDFRTDEYKTYVPNNLAKRPFVETDVMIGRYGPPVFQIFRGLCGTYNVALMKASPREGITDDFIFYLLQENKLHNYVVSNSERTAGQSGVNLDLLEKYPAYKPPIELLKIFSKRIANVSSQIILQNNSMVKFEALFSALQHHAFQGQL